MDVIKNENMDNLKEQERTQENKEILNQIDNTENL